MNQSNYLANALGVGYKVKGKCVSEVKEQKSLVLHGGETFSFDFVGGEDVQQEEIFVKVGKPIVDQCLQGYNGSIFAYGQTGSGKTYTIQGRIEGEKNN